METTKLNKNVLVEMGYKEYQPLRNYINSALIKKTQLYQKKNQMFEYYINVTKVTIHDMENNGQVQSEWYEFNSRLKLESDILSKSLKLDSTGITNDDLRKFEELVRKLYIND